MEHQRVTSKLPTALDCSDALFGPDDPFDSLFGDTLPTLDSLAPLAQWVAWREEPNAKGKLQKLPYNPGRPQSKAKANDPATWGTRAAAELAASKLRPLPGEGKRGVGIELGAPVDGGQLHLGGVDLDSCLDPLTDDLAPWAAAVVERFASYAEISPSGQGLKVFFTYAASDAPALVEAMRHPETGNERYRIAWSRGTHCEIGLDVSNRYYAVTGNRWAASPSGFRTIPMADLLWLLHEAGPAFLAEPKATEPAAKARDESGSGYGYRFLKDQAGLGHDREHAIELLHADDSPAGEWAARAPAREIANTWKNAKAAADKQRPLDAQNIFEEEPDESVDPVTARLNRRHAVVAVRGRTLVTTERKQGSIDFGTPRDLHAYYENDRVPAGDGKREPASRRWMRNPGRRSYPDGVTFAPGGCASGTLNLWRGWAVEPDAEASCALFLDHVRAVICRDDADHTAYVLGWLAHMVQRPDEKPGVGLILKGGKGAGKDTVAEYVALMIGRRHAPTVAESDHIVGKFNARLENALLLHVQEGSWAGDRKAEGVLKYLVTSDRIEIERKGIDSINLPSVLRLFISANAEWVVPASPDERRWAVFEVSDARRGDEAYFRALRAEMDGSGPAALLHYLRAYDISAFNVRKAPETDGLRNQKLATLRNVDLWWFETLSRGAMPTAWDDDSDWAVGAMTIGRDGLRNHYLEWVKSQRFETATNEVQFGHRLRELVPEIEDRRPRISGTRVRQYLLPPLAACRSSFERWISAPVEWECAR